MDSAVVGGFLQDASQTLKGWVDDHPIIGAIAYVLATAFGKLVPLPAGGLLILTGGYLFGTLPGGLLAAMGGALSSGIALIVSRQLLAGFVERRFGARVEAVKWIIAEDAFNYILSIRLIPIMPAWLSNILPAPFDIPVPKAMLATFIGVLPVSFILASIGDGIQTLTAEAEELTVAVLLKPEILLPLTAMAVLALLPVAAKHWRRRRAKRRLQPPPADRQPEPFVQDIAEQARPRRHQGEAAGLGEGTGQGIGEKPGRQQPQ
ncbi:TVP38/TMEM64 family protein [Oceanibaculum nanhaiense]|uniref:TVP38/TMEM64 family protein n=1 Tax=Oceanibaculum nanhaiense TaxID=1909734 RepID=UPI003899552B